MKMMIMLAGALACAGTSVPKQRGDQEPDLTADRQSCFAWCEWNMQRCNDYCTTEHPDPDTEARRNCIVRICEHHPDPNIGKRVCEDRCDNRFSFLKDVHR